MTDSTRSRETTSEAAREDAEDSTARQQCPSNTTQVHNGMHKDFQGSQ
jgi:hypothetical protein